MSRRILQSLLLFIVLALLFALPFTPAGARLAVNLVDAFSPLQLRYESGSLAGRLHLEALQLSTDSTDIQLRGVELELNTNCLWLSKVCLQDLVIERLEISLRPDEAEASPVARERGVLIQFPVTAGAEQFTIHNTAIYWSGGSFTSGLIRGGVAMDGSQLRFDHTRAHSSYLDLGAIDNSADGVNKAVKLPMLDLPLELLVEQLVLEAPRWRFKELEHQHELLELVGRWQGTKLELVRSSLSSEAWGSLLLAGEMDFSGDWPVSAQATVSSDQPPLWAALHEREIEVALAGSLGDLQLSVVSPGQQTLELSGRVNTLVPGFPFELQSAITWSDPWVLQTIPGITADLPAIELTSPWYLKASGTLESQVFTVNGSASTPGYSDIELALNGQYLDQLLTLADVQLLDETTASRVNLNGVLTFADVFKWDLNLVSVGLGLPAWGEIEAARIEGHLSTRGQAGADDWRVELADVAVSGQINGTPASISGYFAVDSQFRFGTSELRARASGAELSLAAQVGQPPHIDLEIDELGYWLEGGRGSLSLVSRLDEEQQRLHVMGKGQGMHWQGLDIAHGQLSGHYDLGDAGGFALSAELLALDYADWSLSAITVALSGSELSQKLSVTTEGDFQTRLSITGQGWGANWSGLMQPANLATPIGAWELIEPVDITWHEELNGVELAPHCWQQEIASVCSAELLLATSGKASFSGRGELQLFDGLLPENMSLGGNFEGSGEAQWRPDYAGLASISASLSGGVLSRSYSGEDKVSIVWDNVSLQGVASAGAINVSGDLQRGQLKVFAFDLALPREEIGELAGVVAFESFELDGLLKPFIPLLEDHGGSLQGTLELSGSLEKPSLGGHLVLTDGWVSLVGNPTSIEALNLTFQALGHQVDIAGGFELGGGATRLEGSLELHPQRRLDLGIRGERQMLLWPPDIEAVVSENLRLLATDSTFDISGDITVHEGELEQTRLPEGSVDISPDVVQVDFRGEVIKEPPPLAFSTHVDVNIPGPFSVVGPGLQTIVGGELNLRKTATTPLQLFGELNILSGDIDVFGQNLTIQQGNLSFAGEPDNPSLNIRAEREIREESIRVGVDALGNLEAISFHLYSSPPMSETEMMSYLLRGRGLDAGTEGDGAAAAAALALGLGAVNKTGLIRGVNKIPGVSGVSFGTEGSAQDTAATVGGYIGDKLYLSYGIGVYEPINVLTARFYLLPRLWVEVVSRLENSADIYYAIDIK